MACALLSPTTPTPLTPSPTENETVTSATSPTSTFTPAPPTVTSSAPQPETALADLIVYAQTSMDGYTGGCVETYTPLVSQVCVENRGLGDAGPFVIQVGDAGHSEWFLEQLKAAETHCFQSDVDLSALVVVADSQNAVAESDEANNTWTIPIPTPPALCTVVASTPAPVTETPTPVASSTLAIVSFTVDVEDLLDNAKRLTFHWQTTGATHVQLVSGTQHRFPLWWGDLEPNGSMTHVFSSTHFADPMMSLTALNAKDEQVTEVIHVPWSCPHEYFFSPSPNACALYEATRTDAAEQRFEHGWMIWMRGLQLGDEALGSVIFVFYDNGWFERFDDTWTEDQPESDPFIVPPPDLQQPIRGFGKLWRENNEVRERLGWAVEAELGFPGAWQPELRESIPSVAYLLTYNGRVLHLYDWQYGSWEIWPEEEQ